MLLDWAGFDWSGMPVLLALVVAGLAVEAAAGPIPILFRLVPHPVVLVGRLTDALARRLNRPERGETARRVRGMVTVLAVVALAGAAGAGLQLATDHLRAGPVIAVIAVWVLVAQRDLHDHVARVAGALGEGVEPARAAVSHLVGRSPEALDGHGVARAAIESLAENLNDAVVAPVFWTVVAGLPGLCVYKAVNTMDSMIGHRTPALRSFGWAAARLDDAMNLVPARLAGLMIVLAAGLARPRDGWPALRVMLRDAGKHRSPNAGWPEAAMAGALGLALGGPRRYPELVVREPWLGAEGRARAEPGDIAKALRVYRAACLVHAGLIAVLALSLAAR